MFVIKYWDCSYIFLFRNKVRNQVILSHIYFLDCTNAEETAVALSWIPANETYMALFGYFAFSHKLKTNNEYFVQHDFNTQLL